MVSHRFSWFLVFTALPATILGFIAEAARMFEVVVGIPPIFYGAVLALFLIDWITGMKAAVRRGEAITSKKMPRIIFKLLWMTLVLAAVNIVSHYMQVIDMAGLGINFNFYSMVFYAILNVVIVSQLWSVLENLASSGHVWAANSLFAIERLMSKAWLLDILHKKKAPHGEQKTDE